MRYGAIVKKCTTRGNIMNTLKIDTGEQVFSLNGECEVHFNPSDATFIRKLYGVFVELGNRQEKYADKKQAIGEEDADGMLAFLEAEDKEVRGLIDSVFDVPVCDAVFGKKNIYALSTAGIPLWASLLLAIIEECDTNVVALNKKGSETAQKYIKKYKK